MTSRKGSWTIRFYVKSYRLPDPGERVYFIHLIKNNRFIRPRGIPPLRIQVLSHSIIGAK